MALTTAQYRTMRDLFRGALSVDSANPNDSDVLSFFKQLLTDASGSAALSNARQFLAAEIARRILSGNFSNPTDANVIEFWQALATDAGAGAAMGTTAQYQTMKKALVGAFNCDFFNPTQADILSYVNSFIPFPSTVSPTFWIDGRTTAYSDAAKTTVATAPLGRVNKAPQVAPLTGDFTSSNTTDSRPFRDATSFCLESVPVTALAFGGLNFSGPAGVTLPANNTTIAFTLCNREMPNQTISNGILYGVDNVSGNFWGAFLQNGELRLANNSAVYATGIYVPLATQFSAVCQMSASAITVKVSIGGVTSNYTTAAAPPAGTINALTIGLMPVLGSGLNASISQLLCVPRANLTAAEVDALLAWLGANPPAAAFPSTANFLTILADSIGVGFGLIGTQMYTNIALPALEAIGPQLKFLQGGFPGYTIAQSQTLFNSTILPLYSSARSKNVAVMQVGTNSLAFGVLTPAQWLTAYYGYCDTVRAAGFKVIACTLLPRTDGGIRGDYEANRLTVNADIVANFAAHADGLCNFGAVAGMSTPADTAGANYLDLVHPAAAGAALLRPVYQAACAALL